jgi:hypothetical protein
MKKIKNIYFFDFDNTMVEEPQFYENYDPTSDEFMDSLKSLKCDFEPKKEIKPIIEKSQSCDKSLTVILTNRTQKLKDNVIEILSDMGIEFDDTLFRIKDRSKGNRIKKFLKENDFENIENIYFWDDKEKHIKDVKRISDLFPHINFKVTLVD